MEVKACRICKKLYHGHNEYEICPECEKNNVQESDKIKEKELMNRKRFNAILTSKADSEDLGYEEVKGYIVSHPRANIMEISNETKVSPSTILNWVKEEKLEFSDESKDAWFQCSLCGVKIASGTLCFRCK